MDAIACSEETLQFVLNYSAKLTLAYPNNNNAGEGIHPSKNTLMVKTLWSLWKDKQPELGKQQISRHLKP